MEIRDPVHGFVEMERSEARILDHSAMQRLRRVSQLAMAYLAFPGAVHTRFDHSLGVMHVASRMGLQLGLARGSDDLRHVRLAALVHDIGHGPFSHVSEYALEQLSAAPPGQGGTEKVHERITMEIVEQVLYGEARLISAQELEGIRRILTTDDTGRPTLAQAIVSGPLDADKLDYLLRDSYFCGVRYGVYDLDRVLQSLEPLEDQDAVYLAVHQEDTTAIEQFVLAKYNMQQVYAHKVRRIADAMLVRAVVQSADDGNEEVRALYTYEPRSGAYIRTYLQWDDRRLQDTVLAGPEGGGKELMRRLVERRLLKQVFHEPLRRCRDAAFREELLKGRYRGEKLDKLEREIAEACGLEYNDDVFVDVQKGRTPRYVADEFAPEAILVRRADEHRSTFDAESQLFRHGSLLRGDDYVSVYMPIDEAAPETRKRRASRHRGVIAGCLSLCAAARPVALCPECGRELPARTEGECATCGQCATQGGGLRR